VASAKNSKRAKKKVVNKKNDKIYKNTSKRKDIATNKPVYSEVAVRPNNQKKAVIIFTVAILFVCLVFIKGEHIWLALHNFIVGLFGSLSFLLPVLLIYLSIELALERPQYKTKGQLWIIVSFIVLICTSVFLFMISDKTEIASYSDTLLTYYNLGITDGGPGLVGCLLGIPMFLAFGTTGARIIVILLAFLSVMLLTGTTLINLSKAIKKPVDAASKHIRENRNKAEMEAESKDSGRIDIELPIHPVVSTMPLSTNNESDKTKLDKLNSVFGIASKGTNTVDIPLDDNKHIKDNSGNSLQKATDSVDSNVTENNKDTQIHTYAVPKTDTVEGKNNDNKNMTFDDYDFVSENDKSEEKNDKIENKTADANQMNLYEESLDDPEKYIFPPLSLLQDQKNIQTSSNYVDEVNENCEKLIKALNSFGVQAKMSGFSRGPAVTRYEIQPAAGVKIAKITSLDKDLALYMAASSIRIEAPIPGKAAIGIEIPNRKRDEVRMKELIDSKEFRDAGSDLTMVLGRDISGHIVVTNLADMPHLLIAGTTGSGKSVCMNTFIISLIYKASPEDVRIIIIDPKQVDFKIYNGIPHLLIPVVNDPHKAAGALNWAVTEMNNRYKVFAEYNVNNITTYNDLAYSKNYKDDDGQPMLKMPKIVILIDELSDLMMAAPNDVESSICRLAQMARAAGMHLIIATQRPTVNVITGLIKSNIPSRIALTVSSNIDSRTILDTGGAEELLGRGDMLFSQVGVQKPVRIQGCYISQREIESVTGFIKKSRTIDYDEEIIDNIEKNASEMTEESSKNDSSKSDEDPMFSEAVKIVVENGQASTSMIQRKLSVGYARAGRLIDEMEKRGIVGQYEGSKPRKVLMTHSQWLEMNMQKNDNDSNNSENGNVNEE
jgi:S-DNA-T family DNA segregation ATPase FtsK/SpoIIIE